MTGLFNKLLSLKLSWLPLGGALLWLAYEAFGPTHYKIDTILKTLSDRVIKQAVNDIPKFKGVETVAVLNFKGDYNGYVTETLREALNRTGKFKILSKSLYDRLAAEFDWRKTDVSTLAEALDRGRKSGTDAVIFGEVPNLMQDENEAKIEMIVRAADVKMQEPVFIQEYAQNIQKHATSLRYMGTKMTETSFGLKLFLWLLFTVFLPVATFFIPKRIFAKESNFLNFALLLSYTLLSFLFAFILAGFRVTGFWNSLLLILALGLSGTYNYFALSLIEKYS
jgi:hypothetical protein